MGSTTLRNTTGSVYLFNLGDLMKLLKRTFQRPLDRRKMRFKATPDKALRRLQDWLGRAAKFVKILCV
ncbi:hypothetical protein DZC30_06635 [Comamonas testosteroni]|uniref:Uncharacterized protein n=1 Tax=Comamonas testosteroni TaxID=285 RepID=A0A373FR13_COMTE|nr:hypothetical protein DZC30_06635 [Comamonas testosteroni]